MKAVNSTGTGGGWGGGGSQKFCDDHIQLIVKWGEREREGGREL